MSNLKIFAIRDNKVSCFMRPFVESSEVMACRSLHQATKDPQIQLSLYPQDFDLFLLGEMDEVSGKIEPVFPPKFIVSACAVGNVVDRKEVPNVRKNSKPVRP
nr:MAG: nonstructural protein [Microviridae sp.]